VADGLAYKPHSHVIEESQGIALAKAVAKTGARVLAFDPLAGPAARTELADHALVMDSLAPCLEQADVVMVTTPDPQFRTLRAADFPRRPVTVIDFWRILKGALTNQDGIHYVATGNSRDDAANTVCLQQLWQAGSTTPTT
jgi:UDPglucose 6-dehydrogenase